MRAPWWSSVFRRSLPPICGGTQLTHDWARGDFVGIVMLQSIGQALTLLPIIILALSNSDPTRATSFVAYIQIMRLGGAEIGVALMGT
jgi:DHA2 family multidrug resistance protein